MAMAPYVLVLAKNTHQGAVYARRAKLQRGRYRVVASASAITGIKRAEVHILPEFHQRPDRHRILAELRYARCEFFDVEMPARATPPPVDQGDGMGEQLSIEDALDAADVIEQHSDALQSLDKVLENEDVSTVVEAAIEHNVEMTEALEAHADQVETEDRPYNSDDTPNVVEFIGKGDIPPTAEKSSSPNPRKSRATKPKAPARMFD